jgi:hypothetical protein
MSKKKSNAENGNKSVPKKRVVKKRNWAFVVYPDSAPPNWKEMLQQKGLTCVVSPLHDKDINPDDEIKKPHWHVIACYSGPTSFDVVKSITDEIIAPPPQALEQIRGYYRYFTHKDNPEKYQYDESEIQTINGFNISDYVELTKNEVNEIKRRLQALIRQNHVTEYADLMDYLLDFDMYLEYDVASNHTYFFDKYISSKRHIAIKEIENSMRTASHAKASQLLSNIINKSEEESSEQ